MAKKSSACTTVAKGGVGESGASSIVTHIVGGPTSKIIVLRNVDSSLCPNTGAVAVLAINGVPSAVGNLTAPKSSIQVEASPGAQVAAVVHTVPLFNGVVCIRLGELSFHLDECDLVNLAGLELSAGVLSSSAIATRDWYAWNNLMPPKPDDFHVRAEVQVPNPGVDVFLAYKTPQGINPKILLLDLVLVQRPGIWPQLVMWKPAHYDKVNVTYEQVQVFYGSDEIANIPVVDVE